MRQNRCASKHITGGYISRNIQPIFTNLPEDAGVAVPNPENPVADVVAVPKAGGCAAAPKVNPDIFYGFYTDFETRIFTGSEISSRDFLKTASTKTDREFRSGYAS